VRIGQTAVSARTLTPYQNRRPQVPWQQQRQQVNPPPRHQHQRLPQPVSWLLEGKQNHRPPCTILWPETSLESR
jgi:hypothetical protein